MAIATVGKGTAASQIFALPLPPDGQVKFQKGWIKFQ